MDVSAGEGCLTRREEFILHQLMIQPIRMDRFYETPYCKFLVDDLLSLPSKPPKHEAWAEQPAWVQVDLFRFRSRSRTGRQPRLLARLPKQ
jgi:hypothetical protein